jgi:hypothetical protein
MADLFRYLTHAACSRNSFGQWRVAGELPNLTRNRRAVRGMTLLDRLEDGRPAIAFSRGRHGHEFEMLASPTR